jgi:hypothetical protein
MKNPIKRSLARLGAASAEAIAAAMLIATAPMLGACSEDKTGDVDKNYIEGVIIPAENTVDCNASAANVTVTFETDGAYSLEVDDADMLKIASTGNASQAGKHSAKLHVSSNGTGEQRTGTLYITVAGHNRTKLYEIRQSAGADNEVVEWIDKRLSEEYYWLDEYVQKRATFDFSLEYDKFLSSSLLSLTTNTMDGGTQMSSSGLPSRYLYSYITRSNVGRAYARRHSRAGLGHLARLDGVDAQRRGDALRTGRGQRISRLARCQGGTAPRRHHIADERHRHHAQQLRRNVEHHNIRPRGVGRTHQDRSVDGTDRQDIRFARLVLPESRGIQRNTRPARASESRG